MQGLDFSPDEKYLFVADYSTGVYRIDMKNKNMKYLSYPDNLMMLGIDGLYFYNNSLIAVQNGASPQRIVRMYLNDTMYKITNWKTVEVRNPEFDEPTLGTIVDDKFYYIGNSQWRAFNNDGSLKEDYDLSNPKVFVTELER
jgi:hypothetical protein